MTQTLIDRISRAVYAKGLEPPSREVLVAVIEAMREPTKAMLYPASYSISEGPDEAAASDVWKTMIDVVLNEEGHTPSPSVS
jgi:hypothetical protein